MNSGAYASTINQAAATYGIPASLIQAVMMQESGGNPSAKSSAGAEGLMQLMPSTASSLGVSNPLDPTQSINGGAQYLAQLYHEFNGNIKDTLAAYNAGPGAVQQYGGVPPYAETQNYVNSILGKLGMYGG